MLSRYRLMILGAAFAAICAATCEAVATDGAEACRVLPPKAKPNDQRLDELKNLNGYFPFKPQESPEAWAARAEQLRRRLLVATGLWPMPTKTPAHAVVHGKIDRGDYTVEKVYLESFPGHFVTGNLYRPKNSSGRGPAVLCPHGHWPNGRFHDAGEKQVRRWIVEGAERFEEGGRHPIQARCAQLARMGCTVFNYDMVGYADSVQLEHRPGLRESMNTAENWGYFSPAAEARLQNMMGLQTYNSIRALDWLMSLPEVDPQRVGVTGASGGGTQTFMLCAIDPRPAVAFPAVMVSTAMQGGCTCENACYLRIGTGNVEIAALIAPRPLGLTAADDWTRELATKGLPELKAHYEMLGVSNHVMGKPLVHFKHNYNYVSRAAMYAWFNRHLNLGFEEPIVEEEYRPLSVEEMTVWNDEHPEPASGDDYERALLRWITADSQKQLRELIPHEAGDLAQYRKTVGGAFDVMIGRRLPEAGQVEAVEVGRQPLGEATCVKWLVRFAKAGEELPVIELEPQQPTGHVVVWVTREGKRGLLADDGKLLGPVSDLLEKGVTVVGVDLFGQGEFTGDGEPIESARMNDSGRGNWTEYLGYTYGYNPPVFSRRVHDVLTVVAWLNTRKPAAKAIDVVGWRGAGHWVAAARAQAGSAVRRAAVDTAGFRFAGLMRLDHPDFLPGGAKYLDVPGVLALSAPEPLLLIGEDPVEGGPIVATYRAAGAGDQLKFGQVPVAEHGNAIVDWLLRP
jgi:dienelactone hydrolase